MLENHEESQRIYELESKTSGCSDKFVAKYSKNRKFTNDIEVWLIKVSSFSVIFAVNHAN